MLKYLMVLAAVFAFTTTIDVAFESSVEARGGRGGRGGYKGGKGKGYGKGSKGPSEEEIAKLKEKYPDTWEEELKKLSDKYKKYGGKGKKDVKADLIPAWRQQRLSTWVESTEKKLPLVLAFVAKKDELNTKYFVHKKAADLSRDGAIFVWIMEGQKQIKSIANDQADKIKAFGEEKPRDLSDEEKATRKANMEILKRSRLNEANLWEAYDIKKGNTFLICDQWGNEFKRYKTKPSGTSVVSAVKKIEGQVKAANNAAKKVLGEATELKEKGKLEKAVKKIVDGNPDGHIGYENAEAMHAFVEEIIAEHDEALKEAIEENDSKALKSLAKTWAGTRIAKSATDAIAGIEAAKATASGK